MPRKREDSFKIALETLRAELRAGAHAVGARLTANEIAERLSLSQTPVREALSRLAGEGLLQDRRGQGFFVPSLSPHDLVALFQLQHQLLRIACVAERSRPSAEELARLSAAARSGEPRNLAVESERWLRLLASAAGTPLARHLGRLQDQLASVRAVEHRVLGGLEAELANLATAVAGGEAAVLMGALDSFFDRRIRVAPALARLQAGGTTIESI